MPKYAHRSVAVDNESATGFNGGIPLHQGVQDNKHTTRRICGASMLRTIAHKHAVDDRYQAATQGKCAAIANCL